jgi:protein TonB
VRFTEPRIAAAAVGVAWLLAGCGSTPLPPVEDAPQAAPSSSSFGTSERLALASPSAARSWEEFRRQAALRMVAANPGISYSAPAPDPLLAIPVLEIELNGDGSVRNIHVLRHPRQARDTTQIAIEAVRRAAPYGDMRHLKKPWKFAEVFLFDGDRRFKPRTLDE